MRDWRSLSSSFNSVSISACCYATLSYTTEVVPLIATEFVTFFFFSIVTLFYMIEGSSFHCGLTYFSMFSAKHYEMVHICMHVLKSSKISARKCDCELLLFLNSSLS